MKKITLALLFAMALTNVGFGQVTATLQAPPYDGSSTGLSLANGLPGVVYHRSCYLILQSELTGFLTTNSVVTTVGIDLTQGCNVATTGQYTVFLQNTTDVAYNKGQVWSSILTGMSTNYLGTVTFPVNTGFTTVAMPLTNTFNYTGGGIYIACEWYAAAPTATLPARTQANSSGLTLPATTGGGCYGTTSVTAAPGTLTNTTTFRPAFSFRAANSATNEVSVTAMNALGKVSKLFTAGHVVTAQIRNNSNQALTNVPVTLTIGGANPFTNVKTVSSVGAGSFATITFDPYNPTVNGLSTMSVTVPVDQNPTNNLWVWSQTVTCSDFAQIPPLAASSFSDSPYGWNNTIGGIYSWRMTPPSNASCTSVYCAIATGTGVTGNNMYGVVMDATGNIIATSSTVNLTAAMQGNFVNFNFSPPVPLTGGTPYLFGVAQPVSAAGFFPFANLQPGYFVPNFYLSSITGGAPTNADRGYIAIGAVVNFSNTIISATANKTVVCNNKAPVTYPQSTTLTASGATGLTYSWSPGSATVTAASVVVTPSTSAASGVIQYTVTGNDATSGCKSNQAVVTVSLQNCTGIPDNTGFGGSIVIFPNPTTSGKAVIKGLEGANSVTVFNVLGQAVLNYSSEEPEVSIDLQSQPTGTYMVKVTSAANQSRIIKVVKD